MSSVIVSDVESAIDTANIDAPQWVPQPGRTFCNFWTLAVARLMGAPMPTMTANELFDWLKSKEALAAGWVSESKQRAQQWANFGGLAVAVYKNVGGHGHIAPLTAPPPMKNGEWVANVGKGKPQRRKELLKAFGAVALNFYTYNPKRTSAVKP